MRLQARFNNKNKKMKKDARKYVSLIVGCRLDQNKSYSILFACQVQGKKTCYKSTSLIPHMVKE